MRTTATWFLVVTVLALAIGAAFAAGAPVGGARAVAAAAAAPPIAVDPVPPSDIGGAASAPSATLSQAAAFAWREFFALNWTAQTSTSSNAVQRDTPDTNCTFGKAACAKGRPLVWQTYRGKVEIFPGTGNAPASYTTPPPGAQTYSYGYDASPNYNYGSAIAPCPSQSQAPAPWVNLDETDQIGLDSMYAGGGVTPVPGASPGTVNSQPQLIRFVAKGNRALYSYVEGYQFWQGAPGGVPSAGAPDPSPAVQPYGTPPAFVSLPTGTIETKSGWRPLTAAETSSGAFVTTTARYYETTNGKASGTCWRQATFGLVALHIIQKTPTAPYFVYATFEQAANLLTPAGKRVEDDDGAPIPNPAGVTPPPTTPRTRLVDVMTQPTTSPPIPPRIVADAGPCAAIGMRLYYRNAVNRAALPQGPVCVNRRQNPIPPAIVAANQSAHAVLAAYEGAHGGYHSPFEHYKLINVQYVPIDKNAYGTYQPTPGPSAASDAANYATANIVVETNHTLQLFSGGLVQGGATGSNSDFPGLFAATQPPRTFKNTYYNSKTYDMGGCMGCHGAAGQQKGGDFSVITVEGSVTVAEYPAPVAKSGAARAVPRNRTYGLVKPRMLPSH